MITLLFILIILLIIFLVINYNKLKYQNKMFDSLNEDILKIKSDIKSSEKLFLDYVNSINTDYVNSINTITNTVRGLTSPVKTIAGEVDKIKDIHSVIYKIQTNEIVIKNMVEETRNIVKASKTRKSTKVSKTSSKEKSANSEALKGSQTPNSSNK